jgi:class 3 adenylate cyclase
MFCDLVGSTALSARLDPEDLRAVIGAYHRCCAEVIERSGGFIAKYMGDGVLAYFGYPRADEHDAERAVRAGLQLVEAVAGLDTAAAVPLQVRVGIGTGLVVVGDLIGQGAAQEQAVGGETSRPNRVNHLSRFVPTLDTREALVQARFSPNRQGSPVADESGPMPPEFRGRVLRRRRAGPPMPDIAILYLG